MKSKKLFSILALSSILMSSLLLSVPALAATDTTGQGFQQDGNPGRGPRNQGTPGIVTSISGTTITMTEKKGGPANNGTTITVDASKATFTKSGQSASLSDIAVGDMIMVQGTKSGNSIAATKIEFGMKNGQEKKGVVGTVVSISGTTITVTEKMGNPDNNSNSTSATTTYTVDASNATVSKDGQASSISAIAAGDRIMIQGTKNGTNITATRIEIGNANSFGESIQGDGQPVVAGTISSINGTVITITNKNLTYTVDASNAKFVVPGVTNPTISNLTTGSTVIVQGAINGTSVTATSVISEKSSNNITNQNQPNGPFGFFGGIFHHINNFFKNLFRL